MCHCCGCGAGFLTKQGHVRKNWKLRYFTLTNGVLLYGATKGSKAKGQVGCEALRNQHRERQFAIGPPCAPLASVFKPWCTRHVVPCGIDVMPHGVAGVVKCVALHRRQQPVVVVAAVFCCGECPAVVTVFACVPVRVTSCSVVTTAHLYACIDCGLCVCTMSPRCAAAPRVHYVKRSAVCVGGCRSRRSVAPRRPRAKPLASCQ